MTTMPQTNTHEKTHGKVGLSSILGDYPIATIEALPRFNILAQNYPLLNPRSLIVIDDRVTVTKGELAGNKLDTADTIGMVLQNKDYEPTSLRCVYADDLITPIITDTSQPCAYLIGPLNNDSELIAVDNFDDGMTLAKYLTNEHVTIAISPTKWLINETVKHFSQDRPVTIFTTLDKLDEVSKPLAGHNVKVVVTSYRTVLEHLEYGGLSYAAILADSETTVNNLQADAWDEPEPLANDPSVPTPYPINAFTGLLRQVIETVANYAQVPLAMAGQCVLGALAHMGQRFIDAPFLNGHKPTSLILITEAESGTGKTETMNLTHLKINEYEKKQYEQYLIDLDIWEVEKSCLKGNDLKTFLESIPKPYNPETVFKEATVETILDKYVNLEIVNGSWATDDAAQFFNGYSMTSKTAANNLTGFTDLYSGGVVNRTRSLKNAFANPRTKAYDARFTLTLMAQRIILEPALSDPLLNGQGFLPRALIACPEDLRGYRTLNDPKRRHDNPDENPYLIEYWSRCESLLNPLPANEPIDTTGKPKRIKMQWANDKTAQVFDDHRQVIEDRLKQGGMFTTVKAYASRMAENASRIASLMVFFDGRKVITTDDITRSFMLVEYSTAERLRYLDATPTGELNDSEKLSQWLIDKARGKNPHKLNRTDIYNGAPKPMRKNNRILQGELDNLESKSHIRQTDEGRKKIIEVNPKLYK